MKSLFFCALASLAIVPLSFAQAPVGPGSVKLGKIEAAAPSTPEYQITGGQNKRFRLGKWLEFEVSYDTAAEEIDELTFKYTVQLERKLLTGEVTYQSILKGKDHFAVMYISPKSIDRLTGGKPLTSAGVENVWVEVSRQGQLLDRTSLKPGNVPNAPQVAGMIQNKNETPFAPLYYDRYELIKSAR